jgi:hypothetical protein
MKPPRYPREALIALRETEKESAALTLAEANAKQRAQAEVAALAASEVCAHDEARVQVEREEREGLSAGLRASELQQLSAFQVGADFARTRLESDAATAQTELERRASETEMQRSELGVAYGKHEASVRDRLHWEAERRKKLIAVEEEATEDAFLGRKKGV